MKTKKLTCETARTLPIMEALAMLGYIPSRERQQDAWFLSPLRSETHASFKVSKQLNRWFDHGIGKGGNVIDLVCAILEISVADALLILAKLKTVNYEIRPPIKTIKNRTSSLKILEIKDIQHGGLITYLKKRKIPYSLAKQFCKEVHFQLGSKHLFSIGFENISGGWELRNPYFKSCTSPKDITHIQIGSKTLVITEGMFDFLSILAAFPKMETSRDFLILNSLSLIKRSWSILEHYDTIELYLDRDQAGRKATTLYLEKHSNKNCTDKSIIYRGYCDVNDWLLKRKH
ncbi:toprim domain-containing protein [Formosa sp. PL04]|uniref:toprim domain-containing protein n=1 Tax=Formosa sp. PL04 TaxID=3081755 RepID=UPI0029818B66|nr:toprim domain-containing protein [Formosa sp. PL04]MDW5290930.1 toprim domain-containing protein [Formosa sp. PL04]